MIEVLDTERQLKIDKSNWTLVKLGDLAEDISKRVDNPAQSGYDRFVGLEHFVSGDLKIKSWGTTESLTSAAKAFKKGDVLFARRNAYLRRASLVDFNGICSGDAFVVREKHDRVIPGFLALVLNSEVLWDYANSNAAGTMSKRVKWRDLEEYKFLLPPKEQQEQMSELLWAGDHLIQQYLKLKNKLENVVDSNLQSAFSYPDSCFSTFTITPLREICEVQTGIAKGKKVDDSKSIDLPYLSVANVQDGYLDLNDVKKITITTKDIKRYSLKIGDVLITEGGDFDKVGRGTVWRGEIDTCLHQNHVFSVRPNVTLALSDFISFQTGSKYGKNYFLKCAKKTSNLASINSTQLKEFPVILPPLEEQIKLVEDLLIIKKSIIEATKAIDHSKLITKALLQQVFSS